MIIYIFSTNINTSFYCIYIMRISNFIFASLFASSSSVNVDVRFNDWVDTHDIEILNDAHYLSTLNAWYDNDVFVTNFNNNNATHRLGHNQFSGMTTNEFHDYLGYSYGKNVNTHYGVGYNIVGIPVEDSVNWVANGGVTPVKNQGQCGSCWSFSTTGALEGAYFIKTGVLSSFSEQQLVDCDRRIHGGSNNGCDGGLMDNAFKWIGGNNGLCVEDEYPYLSGDTKERGTCNTSCKPLSYSKVVNVIDVPPSNDDQMMCAIMKQPVSVAIQADQREFQLYESGVFTGTCGTGLDHGVLVVGYGNEDGSDYYLIKNSWGTTWGVQGYIKLGRGPSYNNGNGQCGLLMQASYPVL